MKNDKIRQFVVVFSVVSTLVVTGLTIAGAFGGQPLEDEQIKPLVQPAGYAFSIWGLIYPGLLVFAAYQALPSQRQNPRFRAAAPWVIANCVLNALWLPLAYHRYETLTVVLLFGYLVTLIFIAEGLEMGRRVVPARETWLARVPFALYFGWITLANVVNVASWLQYRGVGGLGLGKQTWAVVMLAVAFLIGFYVFRRYRSVAYLLVFAWGYAGIVAANNSLLPVQLAAGAGAVAALVLAGYEAFARKSSPIVAV